MECPKCHSKINRFIHNIDTINAYPEGDIKLAEVECLVCDNMYVTEEYQPRRSREEQTICIFADRCIIFNNKEPKCRGNYHPCEVREQINWLEAL